MGMFTSPLFGAAVAIELLFAGGTTATSYHLASTLALIQTSADVLLRPSCTLYVCTVFAGKILVAFLLNTPP